MHFGRYIFLGTLIGLAACTWLTVAQPRTLADLRAKPATPTPIATVTPDTSPSIQHTPVVAGQARIKILFYGVQLTVTDPVNDLVYGEVDEGGNTWAGFTTKSLLAKYTDCKAGALGTLMRTKAKSTPSPTPTPSPSPHNSPSGTPTPFPTKTPANQPFKKTINGYTYTYRPSYAVCASDTAGRNTIAAAKAALLNGVLPTLSD